jgi:hypothetical protein
MPPRMPVSKGLRFAIFERDRHTCQYCGRTPPEVVLTVDHVVPVSAGGPTDPNNLVAACVDCNVGKAASLTLKPVDNAELVAKLESMKQRRRILRATAKAEKDVIATHTERTWVPARYWIEKFRGRPRQGEDWVIDSRFFTMLGSLLNSMPLAEIIPLMDGCANKYQGGYLKSEKEAIKYFCGCVKHFRLDRAAGEVA